MVKVFAVLQDFLADQLSGDRGATAVEYALLVFLISIAIVFAVLFLGLHVAVWFARVRAGF